MTFLQCYISSVKHLQLLRLFVCYMYIIQLSFFITTIFLFSNTRFRESSPVMHVHACYLQDKRVSFLQGIQPD